MGRTRRPLADRFWEKVQKPDGCWLWTASVNDDGYGKFSVEPGSWDKAHRVSWLLQYGSFPELKVLHRCDTPACVRPDHLFLGTDKDNYDDMVRKGRKGRGFQFEKGEGHARARLFEEAVRWIRSQRGALSSSAIAEVLGVSQGAVWAVLNNKTWRHVS